MVNIKRVYKQVLTLLLACFVVPFLCCSSSFADDTPEEDKVEVSARKKRIVVSMGDSYSSGEGIDPFYGSRFADQEKEREALDDWIARRSIDSWPGQLRLPVVGELRDYKDGDSEEAEWLFCAATGAVTWHIEHGFEKHYLNFSSLTDLHSVREELDPQIKVFDKLETGAVPDYITLTLGGNDLGFVEIVTQALLQQSYKNPIFIDTVLDMAEKKLLEKTINDKGEEELSVQEKLRQAYKTIYDRASDKDRDLHPWLLVAGYPHLLNDGKDKNGKSLGDLATNVLIYDQYEAEKINKKIDIFNATIRKIVDDLYENEHMQIVFVDVTDAFRTHEAYTKDPWINGVVLMPDEDSVDIRPVVIFEDTSGINPNGKTMHPTATGAYMGYRKCVQEAIDKIEGRKVTKLLVTAFDADTKDPITDKEIAIKLSDPDLECTLSKQRLGKEDGKATFYISKDIKRGQVDSDVVFHIDGYKEYTVFEYPFVDEIIVADKTESSDLQAIPILFEKEEVSASAYINEAGNVVFGCYEQDGDSTNGKEPIEWVVLDENADGKLLMSRYVLDAVPFNNELMTDVTWETSSLRAWLNKDFLNEAFTKAEQTMIPKVHLENSGIAMPGGNATDDQVFCLSLEEAAKYYHFTYDTFSPGFKKELITLPTEYAKSHGLKIFNAKDCIDSPYGDEYWFDGYAPKGYQASIADLAGTYWWLRTMGWYNDACSVFPNGCVGQHNDTTVKDNYGVRPALWLDKEAFMDEGKSQSYDAFLRNEATAHFRKDADDTQQFNIKKKLSDGRAYTLDDILKLATKGWGDSISFGEPLCKYIDCGLDGVKELLVSIPINTYAEDFTIDMIVKDIKGELWICYVCDEWSRSYTMITDSGMIVNGGAGGASSGSVEKSFVDKDGSWKKWYKRYEEGSPSSVIFNGSSVNLTDLDLTALALVTYTVDDKKYYCLEQYLNKEPVTPQSTVDTVKARLKKVGMKIYSSEEIESILTERKKAIGLEDKIVAQ